MRALSRLRDGLVGAWCPSVSGWGGNVLRDLSGRNNHGTLTNMDPATDWVVSEGKQALDFDNTNDAVLTPSSTSVPIQFLTVSAFVNVRTINQIHIICIQDSAAVVRAFQFRISSGNKIELIAWIPTFGSSVSTSSLVANTTYHVAATWNGSQVVFYLNGVFDGVASRSGTGIATGVERFQIGGFPAAFNFYNGWVDDIRIYNRALPPNEIRLLASERGIGLRPERKRRYVQGQTFTAARLRQQSLIGSGVY